MIKRAKQTHVVIIDGTRSRIEPGVGTNARILCDLLTELGDKNIHVHYDRGVQGHAILDWVTLASGWGINQSIQQGYNKIASRYQAGDSIFLFGYSRGAYAVRSIAGMIAEIGLVKKACATERNLLQAYRLYERKALPNTIAAFRAENCHSTSPIEMIGVWDTVKALGLPYPILSRLAPMATNFHNAHVGAPVRNAFQALAMHETRESYTPVLWETTDRFKGTLEQVWFRGVHADIGGHIHAHPPARALSNIPLVWMLEKVEECALFLPKGWKERFPMDADAPSIGPYRGAAKFFWMRNKRKMGQKCCEYIHPAALRYLRETDPVLPLAKID